MGKVIDEANSAVALCAAELARAARPEDVPTRAPETTAGTIACKKKPQPPSRHAAARCAVARARQLGDEADLTGGLRLPRACLTALTVLRPASATARPTSRPASAVAWPTSRPASATPWPTLGLLRRWRGRLRGRFRRPRGRSCSRPTRRPDRRFRRPARRRRSRRRPARACAARDETIIIGRSPTT